MMKLKFFGGLLAIYIMATTFIFYSTVQAEPYGYTLDSFEYNPSDDSPLDHGWGVISGTGTVSTEADSGLTAGDNIPGHYMHAVSSSGLSFVLAYPDTGSLIQRHRQFSTMVKSGSSFILEVRIDVDSSTVQKEMLIRYYSEDGSSNKSGDTLNFYLGSSYKANSWKLISRDLNQEIQSLDSHWNFVTFKRFLLKGTCDIDDILLWSRYGIEGYADKISYTQGDRAGFHVSLSEVGEGIPFNYEICRYGGSTVTYASGSGYADYHGYQVVKPHDYSEYWGETFSITIGRDWPSGFYAARISLNDTNYSFIPFIVKEDTAGISSNILFQTASTNWQAYNVHGGSSFYEGRTEGGIDSLSYNRPFSLLHYYRPHQCSNYEYPPWQPGPGGVADSIGAGEFFWWEYYLAHWLETNGYVVEYCDNTDIDNWYQNPAGNKLLKYQVFVSCGHDEYWSMRMRNNTEFEFRNTGVDTLPRNLAFFSANTCYRIIYFDEPGGRLMMKNNQDYSTEIWFAQDTLSGPGPEERLIGSRTIAHTADPWSFDVNERDPFNRSFDPDTMNLLDSQPEYWVFEDVNWDEEHGFGRGRYFEDRNCGDPSGPYSGAGYLSIAGHECQARDSVIFESAYSYKPPRNLSRSDVKVLAGNYWEDTGLRPQVTYYQYPTDPDSSKYYEVFSGGTVQWAWGLLDDETNADPGGRTPKITRNVVNELARVRVSGDIAQNTTWRTNVDIIDTVTVNSGVTLVLNPGIKVRFDTHGMLKVDGRLVAIGTQSDSIKFLPNTNYPAPGDWCGIHLNANASCSLSYCSVLFAKNGITSTTNCRVSVDHSNISRSQYYGITNLDTTHVNLTNSVICSNGYDGVHNAYGYLVAAYCNLDTNSYYGIHGYYAKNLTLRHSTANYNSIGGIYNERGILAADTSIVSDNTIYGIYSYAGDNSIYGCRLQCNIQYGIKIYSLKSDSTKILYDTLTTCATPAQNGYAISVNSNNKVRVYKCKAKGYIQSGLYLNASNALVKNNDFSGNTNYSIFADNYSFPKIRQCRLDTTKTGVYSNNSKPDIGTANTAADQGLCTFLNCGKYYIYHSYNPGTLDSMKALYNYYEPYPTPPYSTKFKWIYASSPIKWNPYLINQPPAPRLEAESPIPLVFELRQNYPNPFNPTTTISFVLDQPNQTTVTIYNIMGQKVITLADESMNTGEHNLIWDGRNAHGSPVSSGIYFYAIQSGENFQVKKMTLLR